MSERIEIDLSKCEDLVALAAAGHPDAWQSLVVHVWPLLLRVVASKIAKRPRPESEDRIRDVATDVLDKLGGAGGHGIHLYAAWKLENAGKTFQDWLFIVTANVVRDHFRRQLRARPKDPVDVPSVKRLLNEFITSPLVDQMGARPPVTAQQTARQLLEFARDRLPTDQVTALTQWIEGADFEEIAAALEFPNGDAARKLVRAAVAVLRREFAAGENRE